VSSQNFEANVKSKTQGQQGGVLMWQRIGNYEYHTERCHDSHQYSGWYRCVGQKCAHNYKTGEFRLEMG
jgi:hypothetical protein